MMRNEVLEVDREQFRAYFNRRPFYVRAKLADHPMFSLQSLAELAAKLPSEFVEYNAGNLPVGARPELTPKNGLTPEETVRRIEECGSWMVLKRVEQDPRCAELMNACLDELEPHVREVAPGMFNRQAFIFVSSPNAVTPLHMDPEHNFLVQIRGHKTVHMWDPEDRFVVREEDLETFHSNFQHRNLPYRDAFQTTAYSLRLEPGQGLHFPVTVPHWVKNGEQVSVSFSITFRTEASQRRELLYRANARLRRYGLKPTPVGQNPIVDATKYYAALAFERARNARAR